MCGKDCEGTYLPAGPVLVAEQLPNDHPVKKCALAYVDGVRRAQGKGSVSTFGGHAWDAGVLLQAGDSGRAEEGAAGHQGVPRRAARCARRREERRRRARHLQHERRTITSVSTSARGDGSDCRWKVGDAEVEVNPPDVNKAATPSRLFFMNLDIALLLAQDGITNGAIYALLALALVLVFSVTRVIFIPQGEFVAFGALTLVALQAGQTAGNGVAC